LHQAMVNLIRNSLHAMSETPPARGGHVLTLEAGPARSDVGRSLFMLRVADTGPGVSHDAMDRMFNPFFTTRATGTGLGLAIVHRIVDAHGGRIAVTNGAGPAEPGKNGATGGSGGGAIFTILLPAGEGRARGGRNGRGRDAAG